MFHNAARLLSDGGRSEMDVESMLRRVGFTAPEKAQRRLASLCEDEACQTALGEFLPILLAALSDAAVPDESLVNFERFVQCAPDRTELFRYLARRPRAVEILIKLFVGSQFLTEILLKNPDYLQRLTQHKRLAEFKYREQFLEEALGSAAETDDLAERLEAVRRYQKWELLRIGACDNFGLFDLKNVTLQLSLLAEGLVQACLNLLREHLQIDAERFCVLAFGKLGGEELNYSSDIDLVFLSDGPASGYWELGQKLIKALIDATPEGFLYRVDMRLRPWGKSGALVNSVEAHLSYLNKHGRVWEKQALLKARPIAGNTAVGREFLKRAAPLIFSLPVEDIYKSVRETKRNIERELDRKGRTWGEVKGGPGSIRDIEFLTQCLQLLHGRDQPAVRGVGTLDGLVRLADLGFIQANEYRALSDGYNFLRTVEHALQLMHHKQVHSLPSDLRELAYLARRLDYPSGEQFLAQYERTVQTVRRIFEKHLGEGRKGGKPSHQMTSDGRLEHLARMEPSYQDIFSEDQLEQHGQMLAKLSDDNVIELQVRAAGGKGDHWIVTIAGRDHLGDLTIICGLLLVHGFDIISGHVFSEIPGRRAASRDRGHEFVNVLEVRPAFDVEEDVWDRYEQDLEELIRQIARGEQRTAHGELAKRVAHTLRRRRAHDPKVAADVSLLPVEVSLDNEQDDLLTVLHIRAVDTMGFLYELTNALALTGFNINRVIISSVGDHVFDTLYVTDGRGEKITDPAAQRELRTAIVLIKHFTHLLPKSPNPEAALLHFRDFLSELFRQENWVEQVASLQRGDVLEGLARLLGVSNFLWEDFLRLQYANLFPVVTDIEALASRKSRQQVDQQLADDLAAVTEQEARREVLNAFKDREMFRIDMRHISGFSGEFGDFSSELTDLAEAVVLGAVSLAQEELAERFGVPADGNRQVAALAICALGKCGGGELGYASDIELMFVYNGGGRIAGGDSVHASEYYRRLVELVTHIINTRQEGIFQVDLRLRPYGRAGSLAVAREAFESYFAPGGAAWPYERQALVKLRAIGGDGAFGRELVELRDRLIYTGEPFDAVAMRAMREKQVRQLVKPGTFNAKLSPGGLVDLEYLVQGLQITHGQKKPTLRATNTLTALNALDEAGLLGDQGELLREAYRFQRRLIDALRMVRGHAKDLTVPAADLEEFDFLARRLGYAADSLRLTEDLESHTRAVLDSQQLLPGGE